MGLITLNLKRVLNWNFIFMSAVAAIFGMISLMNFGDISENIVFGVDIKYFMLDTVVFQFPNSTCDNYVNWNVRGNFP